MSDIEFERRMNDQFAKNLFFFLNKYQYTQAAFAKQMNVSTATTLWRMSRGERMKFQLAFAIAHHSRLYLLDEATAGMDAVFKIELFDMLRELIAQECCVIMTTHDMTEIMKNTDYVAVMEGGRLGEFSESIECTV